MTTKKKYQKPTTKIVQLQQRCQILAGSVQGSFGTTREGYESQNPETWE